MTGIELITKERLKQIAYYPDDSKYKNGELLHLMHYLLDNNPQIEFYLTQFAGFSQETLNKYKSKSEEEILAMIGAFAAAEIDRLKEEKKNDI